jgi:hypothetical protein
MQKRFKVKDFHMSRPDDNAADLAMMKFRVLLTGSISTGFTIGVIKG